MIRLYRIKLSS